MARIYAIEDLIPVVDPTAFVHPTAVLIGDVIVGPNCYVGPGACGVISDGSFSKQEAIFRITASCMAFPAPTP
mgnify:CR=1 FL=1